MKRRIISIFVLVCAGLLFSGYLSAMKLFEGSCAFNEPCPYFLGYPACWYGFFMYLTMFVITLLGMLKKMPPLAAFKTVAIVSLIGIVFSGSFVIEEAFRPSTCAYGLIVYVLIFAVSTVAYRKQRSLPPQ